MTTTMLTTIGVILAAAVALMTVCYGGSALESGARAADAAVVTNLGANVAVGYGTYEVRHGRPPETPLQLVSGPGGPGDAVLTSLPGDGSYGEVGRSWAALDRGAGLERAFVVSDVPEGLCGEIDRRTLGSPAIPTAPRGPEGCFRADGGVAVYYAFLGSPADASETAYVAARRAAG